jgi:hypothetical protein
VRQVALAGHSTCFDSVPFSALQHRHLEAPRSGPIHRSHTPDNCPGSIDRGWWLANQAAASPCQLSGIHPDVAMDTSRLSDGDHPWSDQAFRYLRCPCVTSMLQGCDGPRTCMCIHSRLTGVMDDGIMLPV